MLSHQYPLVSIAMATYNGEKFLAQQLDSIFAQTYKNIELIICDDGSDDETLAIIQSYADIYHCIKLHINEHRLGYVKNFEKAIHLCKEKYIALSDQDDIWDKQKLELQMNAMMSREKKHPSLPILIHSDLCMIDKNNNMIHKSYFKFKKYKLHHTKDLGHILGPSGIMGNTLLFNQNLKNRIFPFPETLDSHDYWIALINELYGLRVTIDKSLVYYRIHQSNASNSSQKIQIHFLTSVKKVLTLNYILPHHTTQRKETLLFLLNNYDMQDKDRNLLLKFLSYLQMYKPRILLFYSLIKHDFIKRNMLYRIKIFLLLFLKKNHP